MLIKIRFEFEGVRGGGLKSEGAWPVTLGRGAYMWGSL